MAGTLLGRFTIAVRGQCWTCSAEWAKSIMYAYLGCGRPFSTGSAAEGAPEGTYLHKGGWSCLVYRRLLIKREQTRTFVLRSNHKYKDFWFHGLSSIIGCSGHMKEGFSHQCWCHGCRSQCRCPRLCRIRFNESIIVLGTFHRSSTCKTRTNLASIWLPAATTLHAQASLPTCHKQALPERQESSHCATNGVLPNNTRHLPFCTHSMDADNASDRPRQSTTDQD